MDAQRGKAVGQMVGGVYGERGLAHPRHPGYGDHADSGQ
jgi:hypothetical protein